MNRKYIIQTSNQQVYPFGLKQRRYKSFLYQVRKRMVIDIPYTLKYYLRKFQKIVELQSLSSSIIKMHQIIEQRQYNQFVITLQFVSYSLEETFDSKIQLLNIQNKIVHICEFLIEKRIIPVYESKYFGLSQDQEIKYLLLPNFQQIHDEITRKSELKNLRKNIKKIIQQLKINAIISPRDTIQQDKTSLRISQRDLSAYNKKFQQKISLIQSKLLLSKYGSNDKLNGANQKLKRKKKFSQNFTQQSISISSQSQNSLNKTQNKVKIYLDKNRQSYKNDRENQYAKTQKQKYYTKMINNHSSKQTSSQQQNQNTQNNQTKLMKSSKLTNSLIIQEQKNTQMQKLKHHKSSFGDYSNYDSQKQQRLKRRISFALQKSQYALNLYQKYQSMRNNNSLKKP